MYTYVTTVCTYHRYHARFIAYTLYVGEDTQGEPGREECPVFRKLLCYNLCSTICVETKGTDTATYSILALAQLWFSTTIVLNTS